MSADEVIEKLKREREAAQAQQNLFEAATYCILQWGKLAEKLNAILSDEIIAMMKDQIRKG